MEQKTPTEEIFNEMKDVAINIWKTYDDTYGYASEKIGRMKSITNYADNAMVFYRAFDGSNQYKMKQVLSDEAIQYINENN